MPVPGYVPAPGEKDLDKLVRGIRNLFELWTTEPLIEETSPDTLADWLFIFDVSAGTIKKLHPSLVVGRRVLTGAFSLFVNGSTGSDANDGLTSGTAFATIQKAIDTAASLDLSIYDVTITVANGTYTGANLLKTTVGAGKVIIVGDETTPSNVLVSTTSASCFFGDSIRGNYFLKGMKLQTTTSGNGIQADGAGAVVEFQNIDFGATGNIHVTSNKSAHIEAKGPYRISGGAERHAHCNHGQLRIQFRTITISNTPAFSVAFASAHRQGLLEANSMTFSGTGATGPRYTTDSNGVIFTGGGGATYFPGNAAHATPTASGGQYL